MESIPKPEGENKFDGRAKLKEIEEAGDPHFKNMTTEELSDEAIKLFEDITNAQTKEEFEALIKVINNGQIDAPERFFELMRNKIMGNPKYFEAYG